MVHDLRLAFRTLRDHEAFALTALVTLAVGIGATTAIFFCRVGVDARRNSARADRTPQTVAAVLTRLMQRLLSGIESLDVISLVMAPPLLAAVAGVACVVPARRASRVDPPIALRVV